MIYETAHRYVVASLGGTSVTRRRDPASPERARLDRGTVVVCAEVATEKDGSVRLRISAPAGWVSADALEEAPPHETLALPWEAFEANHMMRARGDQYGLEFPFSHEMFQEMGADFLTRAFRAAGTIGAGNRVESIRDYRIFDGGGASISAAFDVVYAIDEPGLHPELFVKMPAADPMRKFISSHMLFGETQIAMRFSRLSMPVPVVRYYFGDYCRRTTNGILVTERIPFGEHPIEAVHAKGLDHLVPDARDHYRVLTCLQARLVAFHKEGHLGPDAEQVFPFRTKGAGMPPVEIDPLIDFVESAVGHLLAPEFRSPTFLGRLREDGQRILEHLRLLTSYMARDVDYTGFCHANLNLDNAWFWREPDGRLEAGLIDWGSAGQMSIGQSFQGMLFAAEPSNFLSLRRELVELFVEKYHGESGTLLDSEELLLHAKLASMTGLPLLVFALEQALENYPVEMLREIPTMEDARVSRDPGLGTTMSMLGTFLSEWVDRVEPAAVLDRILAGPGCSSAGA